jgi:1-acyl-sn-glycerol-3-phosphate acyltransferase
MRALFRLFGIVFFQYRCYGREKIPSQGGALVCSNHQSNLDPMVVGMQSQRRMNYLARKSLFDSFLIGWIIRFLDAISIDREGLGFAGLKQTLSCLRAGEMVLLFPEGTRTDDGELLDFKPGVCSLVRRGKVPLVPVGIDGPYQAWPRSSLWPHREVVRVVIGDPIWPDEIEHWDDDQLLAELKGRIQKCLEQARQSRQASRRLRCR